MSQWLNKHVTVGDDDRTGIVQLATSNGWYTVVYEDGTRVRVRGQSKLTSVDASPPTTPRNSTTPLAPETPPHEGPVTTELYESKLTRQQAAAIRRDDLSRRLVDKLGTDTRVRPESIRVVVAGKSEELTYELLGSSERHVLPADEVALACERSPHFQKVWTYIKSRDTAQVHDTHQRTKHVVYMAVITLDEELVTVVEQPGRTLVHTTRDQGYVGLAMHGIEHRWYGYKYNHLRAANSMDRSDNSTMLVDATMRYHCGCKNGTMWLFVVQHNPDLPLRDEEKRLIHYFGTHGPDGMNATT